MIIKIASWMISKSYKNTIGGRFRSSEFSAKVKVLPQDESIITAVKKHFNSLWRIYIPRGTPGCIKMRINSFKETFVNGQNILAGGDI